MIRIILLFRIQAGFVKNRDKMSKSRLLCNIYSIMVQNITLEPLKHFTHSKKKKKKDYNT